MVKNKKNFIFLGFCAQLPAYLIDYFPYVYVQSLLISDFFTISAEIRTCVSKF